MKIVYTGDLHFPITSEVVLTKFLHDTVAVNPDVIIFAGDLAETINGIHHYKQLMSIIDSIAGHITKLILPGNHDLWSQGGEDFSQQLFNSILRNIVEDYSNMHWLESSNFYLNDIAIVGSYLHYDYSAQEKSLKLPNEYYRRNKHIVNNDGTYLTVKDDIAFANEIGRAFQDRLKEANSRDDIRTIVVATHVSCFECQITRRPNVYTWAISTAYFGNLSHESFIRSIIKVEHVLSCHSHRGSHHEIVRGNAPSIKVFNLNGDYSRPERITIEV